ncbi:DUF6893 family small protein [Streptomyces sp. NPDC001858]
MKKIIAGGAALVVAVVLVEMLPDVRRYLRIRRM